jgi:hypothetical protein
MYRTRQLWKTETLSVLMVLVIFFLIPPRVSLSQPLHAWMAPFAPDLHDKFSGVVLTPPHQFQPSGPEVVGTDVLASPVTTNAQNEPAIATNRWIDNLGAGRSIHNVGFNDYRGGDARCGAAVSTNGGTSYVDAGVVPLIASRTDLTAAGDPGLAWSLQGYVYYSCLYFSRSTGQGTIAVSRSTDGGASYPAPVIVAEGSSGIFNDKEFIAVDNNSRSPFMGRVYVCWTEFGSLGAIIKFKRSEDLGVSWLPAAGLTLSTSGSNQGCDVTTGPFGEVYVVWLDSTTNNSNGRLKVSRSIDGGGSFGSAVTIGSVAGPSSLPSRAGLGSYRINSFPRIATDRQGHVFVVFNSNLSCGKVAAVGLDICMWRATSGLSSLKFVQVNAGRTAADQHFPAISISDNPAPPPDSFGTTSSHGRAHVCYIDRSFASTAGDWDTACTHSDLPDGPAGSWITPVLVSDCSSRDENFSGTFIGDYIGVAMSTGLTSGPGVLGAGHLYPVFPRACAGDQDVFSDTGTPTAPAGAPPEGTP